MKIAIEITRSINSINEMYIADKNTYILKLKSGSQITKNETYISMFFYK